MRCPKCGFISFDHFLSCKNCGKDISATTAAIQGTCSDTPGSLFLRPEKLKAAGNTTEVNARSQDGEIEMFMGDDDTGLFGATGAGQASQSSLEPQAVLNLEEESSTAAAASALPDNPQPVRSFADIDITGLGPPRQTTEGTSMPPQETHRETAATQPSVPMQHAAAQLESLDLGGLTSDFSEPSFPLHQEEARSTIHTGTPLDDFVIDFAKISSETPPGESAKRT